MLKTYFRRFHRWLTFVSALPLLIVIGTGLVLSFEPLIQQVPPERPIALSVIEQALARFDPQKAARSIGIWTPDNTMTISGIGPGGSVVVDLRTGEQTTNAQLLPQVLLTTRRLHETLLLDLGWLVTASTIAMLVIACLGLMMGWPRFRNSLAGWHQGTAWLALPLIVLSPLTGLALACGITFTSPLARTSDGGRVAMVDAIRLIAADHDLAKLTSIRQRGGILMARIYVDGELRSYRLGSSRLEQIPRNWPRVIHEGNWGGVLGPVANILTSLALLGLFATGLTIWLRRTIRKFDVRSSTLRSERAFS